MQPMSTAEILAMRTESDITLDQTATVSRISRTTDNMGGATDSPTSKGSVACRIGQPVGAREREIAERLSQYVPWVVTVAATDDVLEGDTLTIGTRVLHVNQRMGPHSNQVAMRLMCTERKQ